MQADVISLGRGLNSNFGFASTPGRTHFFDVEEFGEAESGWPSSMQNNPAYIRFETDAIDAGEAAFRLIDMRVCCTEQPEPINEPLLPSGTLVDGLLLGTGDVVYARVANLKLGHEQPTTILLHLLEADATGEFGLYRDCGQRPALTGPPSMTVSATTPTQIWVDEIISSTQHCAEDFHIAVVSMSGAGSFQVMASTVAHRKHITVGTSFLPSPTELDQVTAMLRGAAGHFYGATRGAVLIESFDLYTNGNCENCNGGTCTLCISNWQSSPLFRSRCFDGEMDLYQAPFTRAIGGPWDPRVASHEFGHCLTPQLAFFDEYTWLTTNNSAVRCGHSIMADGNVLSKNENNFCVEENHGLDRDPAESPNGPTSAWQQLNSGGGGLLQDPSLSRTLLAPESFMSFTPADIFLVHLK